MNISLEKFSYTKKRSVVIIESSDEDDDNKSVEKNIQKDEDESDLIIVHQTKRKRTKIDSFSDDETDDLRAPQQKRIYISDDEQEEEDVCEVIMVPEDAKNVGNESCEANYEEASAIDTKIFNFLDSCTLEELKILPNISKVKAEIIFSMKPFENWKDMVEKIDGINAFNFSKLYDACETYFEALTSFEKLLKKCKSISNNFKEQTLENGTMRLNVEQPCSLANGLKLKHYQLVGLNWLATLFENNCSGILADQMGLGKTIQTIAFIAYLIENGYGGPHLIVCPLSTLDNWKREFDKWLPSLQYIVYTGNQKERSDLRRYEIRDNENAVIITTYNMLISTSKDRQFFKNIQLQYFILDEAHMVKNMKTERYQQLMQIQTSGKLLLTGTPLQNDVIELVSLLTFLMPDLFLQHQEKINNLIESINRENKKNKATESRLEKDYLESIKNILSAFMLRRLKSDVLSDMPPKVEKLNLCELTEVQKQLYQSIITEYRNKSENTAVVGSALMSYLRKVVNHPLLLRKIYDDRKLVEMAKSYCASPFHSECGVDKVYEDMQIMSDFELHCLCKREKFLKSYKLQDDNICDCGKFKYLDDLLPTLKRKGSRVLLFSQFVIVLDIVQEYLKLRNHSYVRLDGSLIGKLRQSVIDEYNNNEEIFIFLISTKAGGLGINLTSANTVIFHDIDFNPYNDLQAEDRCHRIGQTREVTIYKLIAKETIEENMLQIGEMKLKLGENIVESNSSVIEHEMSNVISNILRGV